MRPKEFVLSDVSTFLRLSISDVDWDNLTAIVEGQTWHIPKHDRTDNMLYLFTNSLLQFVNPKMPQTRQDIGRRSILDYALKGEVYVA